MWRPIHLRVLGSWGELFLKLTVKTQLIGEGKWWAGALTHQRGSGRAVDGPYVNMAMLWLLAATWVSVSGADTLYLGLLLDTDSFVFVESAALFKLVGVR